MQPGIDDVISLGGKRGIAGWRGADGAGGPDRYTRYEQLNDEGDEDEPDQVQPAECARDEFRDEPDREWSEGAARQRFLQLLEAQGLEDPWSRTQRRRLSALLFT